MTTKRTFPAVALGLLAAAAFAAPAQADSCGLRNNSQAFAAWGDTANYWLMQNGNFESGSKSWALAGGAVVSYGNEPYRLFGGGKYSLLLPSTAATASSSVHCVQVGENAGRMLLLSPGVPGALLHVQVNISLPTGTPVASLPMNIDGSVAGWAPSAILTIPNLFAQSAAMNVQVSFQPAGVPAAWRIDDVAVDPFRGS